MMLNNIINIGEKKFNLSEQYTDLLERYIDR